MELEEENKQLKTALDMWMSGCKENEFQYESLKQKLEKIKMFFTAYVNSESGKYIQINVKELKEILEEKS